MRPATLFAILTLPLSGVQVASAQASAGMSRDRAVLTAFKSRSIIGAAERRVSQAEANRAALGALAPTRLEIGKGTVPDVSGGEDFLIAQPVDIFGRTSASRASGDAEVRSARSALRQAKLDLQEEVLNSYADALAARMLLESGNRLLDLAEKVYVATKRRVDQGEVSPAQLLRADLDRERARQTVEVRGRALAAAMIRLDASVGSHVEAVTGSEIGLPVEISATRPDIQQSEAAVAAAQAQLRAERLSGLPEFEVQFRRFPWVEPEGYGVRLQLVMPLWDWGASRNRTKASRQGVLASQADLADKRALARAEAEAARADLRAAQAAVNSFKHLADDAATLLQKEQRGFDLGAATLLDVLDSARALREIEESAVDAQLRLDQATAKMMTTTGTILGESPAGGKR